MENLLTGLGIGLASFGFLVGLGLFFWLLSKAEQNIKSPHSTHNEVKVGK